MASAYSHLTERFSTIAQIDHALTMLQWDQLVMMPPGGQESRAKSIAELSVMKHKLLADEHTGELISTAHNQNLDNASRRSLKEMERSYQQAACLPEALVKAQSLAGSRCENQWRTQRTNNDWEGFLKNFKEVVSLAREEAQARQASLENCPTPYDAMLDLYCTGDSSKEIGEIFNQLTTHLPDLIAQVLEKQQPCQISLDGTYPTSKQLQLNKRLMEILQFDFTKGRLDVSLHPFSTGCRGDQRITTRFRQSEFLEALMATAHETGHASYENGLPSQWEGLPIGRARNMCLHESQSLLFEKHIFLSNAFFSHFVTEMHNYLTETQCYTAQQIYTEAIRVQPSYIRVEADEVTYPLHVALRFEIEKDLINGSIPPQDIPELWDQKMNGYLGLTTKDDHVRGCMQDIHWTDGTFGYFPSYTMGAVNAAQIFAALRRTVPDVEENLAHGNITALSQWLHNNIWSKGSSLDSQDIIKLATGEKSSHHYFMRHLQKRYLGQDPGE